MDLYIIRKFMGTFLFIITLLMSLAIVFDISEKIDDFMRNHVSVESVIFDYYLNFVFHYSNLFSSMIIFIAVILFTSKMARNNEITAILCSGVSFNRMLVPYFVSAGIIAGFSIYLNHNVLPIANKTRVEFENKYMHNNKKPSQHVYKEPEIGSIVYFEDNFNNFLNQFVLQNWKDNRLQKTIFAQRAFSDSITGEWKLENYFIRTFGGVKHSIRTGARLDTTFSFTAADLGKKLNYASTMTTAELNVYIREEKEKGNPDLALFEIEKHQRTAYPIASFILTLIAVSVSGRKTRGGTGFNIFIGLVVALMYIFSMKITTVAATNVGFNPFFAVWLPNMIFFCIAVIFYRLAQK
jgi:lipopolysaccharide export system permease protein